ncbi:hypothetical protein DC522_12040 [Microvirga sp. KLBC 81]|uniref:hypothetical protein n=1 Tax=Microvirga sp. KLBC 81 TaxID=1862707 RepID=UPI000D51D2AB|nr:hypothetical protein [Microvirga sp. KLBC 81]PVE24201.1 hypothetical protein DC522_12040 [Microvirga sp. KLBC 81]
MEGFNHLLNWKLKAGSHPFPGKDGGTCINEAALVAAGFEYKPIRAVEEMPDCFSRPICRLAMLLNDEASDAQRQLLLPFVTRLACADTPEVERERATYINLNMPGDYPRFPFDKGLQVLEGALAIGRQAESFAPVEVRTRMEAVQARASTPTSVPDTPLFAKIKNWFGTKETASAG